MEPTLKDLQVRLAPLGRLVELFSEKLEQPFMVSGEFERGFRYSSPALPHFCLLRMCRIVSAFNAAIQLARLGYTQEIGVLLRTTSEYSSQIDFALFSLDSRNPHAPLAADYVSSFFDENGRARQTDKKPFRITQKQIHDAVGASLDEYKDIVSDRQTTELLSNVYKILSDYVHAKYKTSMDLFGGRPAHFHLCGMSGTPKDDENIALLETLIQSASNCFLGVALSLRLNDLISNDGLLSVWFNSEADRIVPATEKRS